MLKALGRLALSAIFIVGGWKAFQSPGGRSTIVEKAGIPQPEQAVKLNALAMIVGGLLLSIGLAPRLASTILLGSMVPTTVVGHPFWQEEDEAVRAQQFTQFLKNLSTIGALLLVLQDRKEKKQA